MTPEYYFNLGYQAGVADKPSTCHYRAHWRLKAWRDGWYAGMNDRTAKT